MRYHAQRGPERTWLTCEILVTASLGRVVVVRRRLVLHHIHDGTGESKGSEGATATMILSTCETTAGRASVL